MVDEAKNIICCLGVIPARGGSKGVPRKNVRTFAGKNLVQLAIEAANGSKLLTETVVNTDSEEIAEMARNCGGNVPFLRPHELGTDEVAVKDVVRWTALWYQKEYSITPDIIVTLQPTSPFRTSEHIDTAISMLLADHVAEGVLGVTEAEHTPYKMQKTSPEGYCRPLFGSENVVQRQDAPAAYRLNGIVYATRWDTLIHKKSLWGEFALPYILPENIGFNIDTPLEFEIAQWLYSRNVHKQDNTLKE